MVTRLRSVALLVLPVATVLGITCASATGASLPGCTNPADSAMNQYCDSTPSAGGPQAPGGNSEAGAPIAAGQPSAGGSAAATAGGAAGSATAAGGTTAPGRAAARTTAGRHAARNLLKAAVPASPQRRLNLAPTAAKVSGFGSVSVWMIVILATIGLALAGAAAIGRHRVRSD